MQSRLVRYAIGASVIGALTVPASAQWSENFDSYSAGAQIDTLPEFENWSGVAAPYNVVTTAQANSGANSGEIVGSMGACSSCSDTIGWLGRQSTQMPYTAGLWELSAMTYVPTGLTDLSYFIGLSNFAAGAVGVEWNIQTHYNPATADITDDGGNNTGSGAELLQFDTWTELRYVIDLDMDTVECYYNGNLLFDRAWSPGVFGNNASAGTPLLQAIDLFPLDGASSVYYDDMSLSLISGDVGTNYCTAAANSSGGAASISGTGSATVADNNFTLVASGMPANQFGIFITAPTQTFIPGAGGGQGNLCVGPGNIGRFNANAGYSILNSGSAGEFSQQVDLNNLPTPMGGVSVMSGQTHNFQAWFRDINPMVTNNFTDGLEVMFL